MFALLAGYLPFDEEVIPALFKKIREADYQIPSHFSPEAQDLVRRMLQPNPVERIRFHQLKGHPWVKKTTSLYMSLSDIGNNLFPNKINEEIFHKVLNMGFNFNGFTEHKIRESILRKKDYSFVIAYDLMLDEYIKQQLIGKLSNQKFIIVLIKLEDREEKHDKTENGESLFENIKGHLEV